MSSEGTGDIATQLTATQPPLGVPGTEAGRDGVESATHPVQGPGTSEVLATQPLLVPGAGTATQPAQAPGAGPEVLPAGVETTLHNQSPPIGQNSDIAREYDSEAELDGELASPASIHCQGDLPDTATDQVLSEDANYRETIRGVRSFMNWHHIPDYDNSAASMDAGSRVKTTGKVSVKLPVDEWLCKKLEKLNITIAEGYPSRNSETSGLLRDQFVKTPRFSKWYDMQAVKKGDAYRQHNSGCLYQQRGGDEIGLPVCPTVENTVLVYQAASNTQGTSHPRPAERDSRQAIQAWPDHSNRVVTSSRSVTSCMLNVASATIGPVCHQVQQQTATVCITGPRPPGLGSGCTQPLLGGPGPIRLPTSSHLGQSGGEAPGLPLQQNNYIPRRKSGIYWIQVRRAAAAAAAAVEISLWTR